MFVRRQITSFLAAGDVEIESAVQWIIRMHDVRPATVLVVGDGQRSAQSFVLDSGDSYTVQLPNKYDSAEKLHGILLANGTIKAVVTSPELTGTSTQLIAGQAGYRGSWVFQQRITSIVLSNPTADPVLVQYDIWQQPSDLSDKSSYMLGYQTTGTI